MSYSLLREAAMKVPGSSPSSLFISIHILAHTKEGPMRVEFYRSLSRLLACVLCAASMHVTADAQTPGQNIDPLVVRSGAP
jgi:hypothetical protein